MRITEFGGDIITATVRNAMLEKSNILQSAEFYPIVGNADNTRKNSVASGGRFRTLNADYPDNPVDPVFATPALKIFGDKVQTDRAHERRGSDVPSVRASDLLQFARDLGKEFQNNFFNGNSAVDVKQFNGLKKIVPAGQKKALATNGLEILTGNTDAAKKSQQAFKEAIQETIGMIDGGAQLLTMDAKTLSRLTTIAADECTVVLDEFGVPITLFNQIPIKVSGYDKSGIKIITNTETCGTANNCTSIYAVRFGERTDLSFATNVGIEVKDLNLVGVHYTYSVDFDLDLVLLNNKSVARLEGIIIP